MHRQDNLPDDLTPTEAIERGVGRECPNCSRKGTLKPALDPYAYRYNDDRERREFGGLTTEQYRKCYPYA
jgi:hypothetical protein